MKTAGVVPKSLDVATFNNLESKKAEEAFETMRTAGVVRMWRRST